MEKKEIKIGLSTFFLILTLIAIVVMGIFMYKFYNEKTEQTRKANELENQVNILNNSINNLQGKINTISTTIASNSSTENTTSNTSISTTNTNNSTSDNNINAITGDFYPQIDGANDASYFSFNSNGTVNLEGNATMSGTYSIENNTIKIKYTKLTEPGMESTTINEEENLTIVDKTTLFDNKTNTTYKK